MPEAISFREGTPADAHAVFLVFEETLHELLSRLGEQRSTNWDDPEQLARIWDERRSLYEHLSATAQHFVVAERQGRVIGFARSICRDGVQELTELFVLPNAQSGGVGRALLARAFPDDGARHRCLVASPDARASALYLKAGLYPRFGTWYLHRRPEAIRIESDLEYRPLAAAPTSDDLALLGRIDAEILDHRRDEEHVWLSRDRHGFLCLRNGRPIGYGYVGRRSGPFAVLDTRDFPAILAFAEGQAVGRVQQFGLETPLVNTAVLDYAMARGFRVDRFAASFMSDRPFGRFENYIFTSPPFTL